MVLKWRYDFDVKRTLSYSRNSPKKLENESQAAAIPSASHAAAARVSTVVERPSLKLRTAGSAGVLLN